MKVLLLILCLGFTSGKETTLQEDFQEFIQLLPQEKLINILLDHLSSDSELQDVVLYLQTEHFQEFLLSVEKIPEFNEVVDYLGNEGVDLLKIIDLLRPGGVRSSGRKTLVQLLDEIAAVLPAKQLQKLYTDKLKTSPHFVHFLEYLHGPQVQAVLSGIKDMPEFDEIITRLRAKGVDLYAVLDYLRWLLTGEK